jgi:hypothetical protein
MLSAAADPSPGDVGDNAALAACPTTSPLASNNAGNYTFGDQVMVEATANGTRTPFVLPAAVLTAECQDLQQLGFLQRVPRDLRVSASCHWLPGGSCYSPLLPLAPACWLIGDLFMIAVW